jgi:hypothetical protein
MTLKQFIEKIKKEYSEVMPNSAIMVRYSDNLYASIWINVYVAGDKTECSNNYWENDISNIRFSIDTEYGEFPTGTTLETDISKLGLVLNVQGSSYLVKPTSPYLCYSSTRLRFRKTKGNDKKIVATLGKYFKVFKDSLIEDLKFNFITDDHKKVLVTKV